MCSIHFHLNLHFNVLLHLFFSTAPPHKWIRFSVVCMFVHVQSCAIGLHALFVCVFFRFFLRWNESSVIVCMYIYVCVFRIHLEGLFLRKRVAKCRFFFLFAIWCSTISVCSMCFYIFLIFSIRHVNKHSPKSVNYHAYDSFIRQIYSTISMFPRNNLCRRMQG